MTDQSPGFYHTGEASSSSIQNDHQPNSHQSHGPDDNRESNLETAFFAEDPLAEHSDGKLVNYPRSYIAKAYQGKGFLQKAQEAPVWLVVVRNSFKQHPSTSIFRCTSPNSKEPDVSRASIQRRLRYLFDDT